MKKRLKKIKSDTQAEGLLDQDLSDYIHEDNFQEAYFDIQPKDKSVTLRMSSQLVDAFKNKADKEGVSYQKLMRRALEIFLKKSAS